MKFAESRPYADPEAAARKLLDIVRASIAESSLPYAYTGTTDTAFTRDGGSLHDYAGGIRYGTAQKWFAVDRSGTRMVLLPDGAE